MAAEALAEGSVCTWRIIETVTETQDCIGRASEFEVARCAFLRRVPNVFTLVFGRVLELHTGLRSARGGRL